MADASLLERPKPANERERFRVCRSELFASIAGFSYSIEVIGVVAETPPFTVRASNPPICGVSSASYGRIVAEGCTSRKANFLRLISRSSSTSRQIEKNQAAFVARSDTRPTEWDSVARIAAKSKKCPHLDSNQEPTDYEPKSQFSTKGFSVRHLGPATEFPQFSMDRTIYRGF